MGLTANVPAVGIARVDVDATDAMPATTEATVMTAMPAIPAMAAMAARRRTLLCGLGACVGGWLVTRATAARADSNAAGAATAPGSAPMRAPAPPGTPAQARSPSDPPTSAPTYPSRPGPGPAPSHPPSHVPGHAPTDPPAHAPSYGPTYGPHYGPHYGPPAAALPLPLAIDDIPQRLDQHLPAGGPLERHTARPGAWYTAVYVPRLPHWPLQLWIWQRDGTHSLRVSALDGWPPSQAAVAVPLALHVDVTARGRPLSSTVPFVLPVASQADGVFVLIEQWSRRGERPPALWLQARPAEPAVLPLRDRDAGWWQVDARPSPGSAPTPPAEPPPGALRAPRALAVIELPFLRPTSGAPRPTPGFEPWWER